MATTEISLSKIEMNFGFNPVLNGFDLDVKSGDKIGIIGHNGSGKTTIFNIILGKETPTMGSVSIRKGARIGCLEQIPPVYEDNISVKDILDNSVKYIRNLEKKIHILEEKMATDYENLDKYFREYSALSEEFDRIGGYELEAKISRILNGFRISNELLYRSYNDLSGGEKTIVNFAALMLSEPDILLLDEPTNHLDIDTLEWLEKYLKSYKGTILLISHDRYFLDNVVQKIVEIDRGMSDVYFGNYSYFLEEKDKRVMIEFEDYKNQQKQIEAMKASIKKLQEFGRLAYPGGVGFFKRAASIQKRLDKMEVLDRPEKKKELPIEFKVGTRSGKEAIKVDGVTIKINELQLIKQAIFKVMYGESVCLMGKNGSGKSTLVKAILGNNDFVSEGSISLGSNVVVGYIPQEIVFDNPNMTILEYCRTFFYGTETILRATLAKFLFYSDDVFKRVGTLSGGEKVRLKLLELIQSNANLIILDEPTNHIDIDTKEILEVALKDYNGTLLFISHDRYFINKVADKILMIEDGAIVEYIGNYDYYKEHKDIVEQSSSGGRR